MKVVSSSDFLREFTIYAEQTVDEKDLLVVQRGNGKNLVVMSMDKYNDINKELFLLKNKDDEHNEKQRE
ncbi:type II toxin-antitoxin system Phd/YefM family antitoxin [Pectinatus sottacetonis]|uniref:type II toxin-antitoxin system Phd/YefM family antitoxin n=1 Tax=Pectinatus sottacetonis TaxID=1002795 RepID=UPI0018C5DB17|nr:type II toxin-antitoxin system Phd/YefM family antitoxin [Pectinatus sottacetonis]